MCVNVRTMKVRSHFRITRLSVLYFSLLLYICSVCVSKCHFFFGARSLLIHTVVVWRRFLLSIVFGAISTYNALLIIGRLIRIACISVCFQLQSHNRVWHTIRVETTIMHFISAMLIMLKCFIWICILFCELNLYTQ